jgi:hypothetical protein
VNKQDYIAQVQVAVSQLHNCGATWRATVPVHEVFQGATVWQGDVEVFDLTGHPKAKRAHAWSHLDGAKDERTRFVAVLEIPPVESAETAVRVQIVKDVKNKMKTIKIIGFRGGLNQDELEFRIPNDYTCKMISHLRLYPDWLGVQIHISPADGIQKDRNRDAFFLHENGDKIKRAEIKKSINGFCEKNGLLLPTWPDDF